MGAGVLCLGKTIQGVAELLGGGGRGTFVDARGLGVGGKHAVERESFGFVAASDRGQCFHNRLPRDRLDGQCALAVTGAAGLWGRRPQ